jgi:hypothetical protein
VKGKVLEIGKVKFNAEYLRSVSEHKAIKDYSHLERSQVTNAWKQANGLTVRNNKKTKKKKNNED